MTKSNPHHQSSPDSRKGAASEFDGHRARFAERQKRNEETWPERRQRFAEREARWLEKRELTCEPYAEARVLVAARGVLLAAWSMMSDATGAEINRHLATLAQPFVERLIAAAWDLDSNGEPRRNWTHWSARAVAVVGWFLATHCHATELHGRPVWRVSGYSMRFFAMLCSVHIERGHTKIRITPGRSTFGNVSRKPSGPPSPPRGWVGALVRVGLLEAHQFDADKVQPHERGQRKWNPKLQRWEQWSFNQWFLNVSPFEPGETRPKQLGKMPKNRFIVRRVTDSILHRQRRNRARRAEEAAAAERARMDGLVDAVTDHPAISPAEDSTAPSSAPSSPTWAPSSHSGMQFLGTLVGRWSEEALEAIRRRIPPDEPPDSSEPPE